METARVDLRWVQYRNPPPTLAELTEYSMRTGKPKMQALRELRNVSAPVLQQLYVVDGCKEEWRDVPTIMLPYPTQQDD